MTAAVMRRRPRITPMMAPAQLGKLEPLSGTGTIVGELLLVLL
jgi:hypothetical protein